MESSNLQPVIIPTDPRFNVMPDGLDESARVGRNDPIWRFADLDADGEIIKVEGAPEYVPIPKERGPIWRIVDLEDDQPSAVDETSLSNELQRITISNTDTSTMTAAEPSEAAVPQAQFSANTSPAQNAALLTVEILELTLSWLSGPDLWTSRNVCQSWRSLIDTSPMLKRVLWLTPTLAPETPTPQYYINPSEPTNVFRINPVLDALGLVREKAFPAFRAPAVDLSFPARWRTVDAAWRGLQICEPPIQRVFLRSSWLDKYLENDSGITAGELADRLELTRVGKLYLFH